MPHSRHDSLDLAAMLQGIEGWVEIESPTSDVAAVNRMIDRVAADLADVPVRIQRLPGRGKVVTSRKGVGRFEAVATGVPAHSGSRHRDGHSAIDEMARQVLAIAAMTDYARGITTNVGRISGGTAANVVPEHCRISIDLRVPDEA